MATVCGVTGFGSHSDSQVEVTPWFTSETLRVGPLGYTVLGVMKGKSQL